ncbi:MAG: toxin-antitoxin system HicB family antitoxin [Chloroflexota bacterium]|nr:toxin-antitoxin system HicB family antitoxin [Chloroflexota bacterium]
MSTVIQIRNVPESTHRRLKARAAMEGVSMSQYVLAAIERAIERPSRRELLAAIRRQSEVTLDRSPADLLRAERAARAEQLQAPHRRDRER